MPIENRSKPNSNNKKKKQKYLPHNKPVKKGSYPLRPGVEGFFITCDGGREKQATHEAINLLDTFCEELLEGKCSGPKHLTIPSKPMNKITKFVDSDDSSSSDDELPPNKEDTNHENKAKETENISTKEQYPEVKHENQSNGAADMSKRSQCPEVGGENQAANSDSTPVKKQIMEMEHENQLVETAETLAKKQCLGTDHEKQVDETEDPSSMKRSLETEHENQTDEVASVKKQRLETEISKCGNSGSEVTEEKSIDKLIEAELEEMGDRNKRRFVSLDSGCNGVIFIEMHKRACDPGPTEIVQHMMKSAAAMKKHMSRFILRVLPIEVTCYASEEEISRAIKPLIARYFPTEAQTPEKFAVLFEARANAGIERMKFIDLVAKSVSPPHKVDLGNPEKTIIVQVAKTICLMGVVEKYKELSKFNLRQLTSSKA